MRFSVSLPSEDVRFLDQYVRDQRLKSRSAALRRAVRMLRTVELGKAYEAAWKEFDAEGEAARWDRSTRDGAEG